MRWEIVLVVAAIAGGCAESGREPGGSVAMAQPRIELLGFGDCPNTPALRASLAEALAPRAWAFEEIDQEALPPDDLRRGYPTPTILVNGRDLFGLPAPNAPAMGCRVYPGGLPNSAAIARTLEDATGG